MQIQQEVLNDDIDPEVATSMMQVQGRYHQIGRYGGQRCFRQEAVADGNPNNMKLFLWFNASEKDGGWYISSGIGAAANHICWSKDFQQKLHCPYWAKKANVGLVVLSQAQFVDIEKEKVVAEPHQTKHKGGGGCGGKANAQASGWMNKCMDLTVVVLAGNQEEAQRLAAVYEQHPSGKDLVAKKIEEKGKTWWNS